MMEAVQVVCPSGLFPLPVPSGFVSEPLGLSSGGANQPQQQQQQLLEQLQVYRDRASRLLQLLSVQREQGVKDREQDVYALYEDAFSCIQQSLQQAAAAKQPLLLTSSQHTSCFCQLLENLHLLDVFVKAGLGDVESRAVSGLLAGQHQQEGEAGIDLEQLQLVQQVDALLGRSTSLISHLEQRLQTVPGIDTVLVALIQHCQQNMASGLKLSSEVNSMIDGKGKAELIDVACLSSIQEQHSAARALPLLLRLYFTNCSRLETVATGKPEALSNKLLEKCLSQLASKPVVPGYADMPVCLPNGLETCTGLAEAAASRKLKLPAGLPTDAKSLSKLEQSYSLQQKVIPLLQQHDMLCDLLSQIALEVRQAVAVDRDINDKALSSAEQLVVSSINFVSAANSALLELDAWRCMQQQQQGGSADRFVLSDSDVVPFMDVAGAVKGLTGLMTDSHSWLQQLLHVHTIKQLHDFAASTLPALSKLYPRNERIQQLLRSALASMQGQLVDLKDDTFMGGTSSVVSSMPVTPTMEVIQGLDHSFHTAPGPVAEGSEVQPIIEGMAYALPGGAAEPGPVAEGLEALRPRWGRRGKQQQHQTVEEEQQNSEGEEEGLQHMMIQAAVAAAEISAEAARKSEAGADEPMQQQMGQQQDNEELPIASAEEIQAALGQSPAAVAEDPFTFTAAEPPAVARPQRHNAGQKHRWGKGLINSMRKGKHKPQPSPDPELCAAPAALAALEEMLSGAEAEYYESEAAAAADEVAPATASSSSNAQTGSNMGRRLRLNLSMLPDDGSPGLLSAAQSNFSSMTSLTAAFDQPPDLPWEKGALAGGQEESPGSVAAAAAAFERLAAARRSTSRLSVNRSSYQADGGSNPGIRTSIAAASEALGATSVPNTDAPVLPVPPHDLDPEEVAAAAALELALGADGDSEATPANLAAACSSPRSAKKFHLFKFRSILQHHEKLSSTGASDVLPQTGSNGSKAPDDAAAAAAESGAVSCMRAALSMGRRKQAADVASAASAILQQAADADAAAADVDDGCAGRDSITAAGDAAAAAAAAGAAQGATPRVSQSDVPGSTQGAADADQPAKQGRVAGIVSRIVSFRPQGREQQAQSADGAGSGKGFKGLNFTAKLKKAMVDRRQAGSGGARYSALQLEVPPPLACLLQLRVILEQLMHEIKTETKKHLMMQLQMAAAAAAGSAGAKPDASIARPLKQVKVMIKAVHRMQLMLDYERQLGTAADLSSLWVSRAYSSIWAEAQQEQAPAAPPAAAAAPTIADADAPAGAAKVLYNLLFEDTPPESSQGSRAGSPAQAVAAAAVSPRGQQQPDGLVSAPSAGQLSSSSKPLLNTFPGALVAGCMGKLDHMPADLPLLALHIFWDARYMLQRCGLLEDCLDLLKQQEEACMRGYITSLVPQAYEHFKKLAAHQTVTQEVLSSCGAPPLQPVLPIYLDALLREPCITMLQGDYTVVAQAAENELSQLGAVLLRSTPAAVDGTQWPDIAKDQQQQQQVFDGMQQALQQLLEQEQEAMGAQQAPSDEDHGSYMIDQQQQQQQQQITSSHLPALDSSKPVLGASPKNLSPNCVSKQKKPSRKRKVAAEHDAADAAAARPAGQTPLMQKLEQIKLLKQSRAALQQQQVQELARHEAASLIDVRQWLLAGLMALLRKDAAELVERCRTGDATIVVEAQLQHSILQRTRQLLSQYAPLPCSWQQLWLEADSLAKDNSEPHSCQSVSARAMAASILQMLDTAAYDSEANVFLPAVAAGAAAGTSVDGVLGEVSAALQPVRSFFGRQHLQSLLLLSGPAGQQHVLQGLTDKMDQDQVTLLEQLQQLQEQLPSGLLQLPPLEHCHDAGTVLQFYQSQLAAATSDTARCSAALGGLQRIGNCLALLHLMALQQSVQATPVFMQAAPFLGIVGRPLTDAAAAAECFEHEGLPPPPDCIEAGGASCTRSCEPGLLMPEIEQLQPTEAARKAHDMQVQKELQQEQAWREEAEALGVSLDTSLLKPGGDLARHRVWQNSYFQKFMLGPDADKVRGPALVLTQAAEYRVWEATQAPDCMGPCLERVQRWAGRLQQKLQGLAEAEPDDVAPAVEHSAGTPLSSSRGERSSSAGAPGQGANATPHQREQQQQPQELDVVAQAALRLSQGEVASVADDVSGIGVHDNSLYQQQYSQSPDKRQQQQMDELSADAESAPPQQEQQEEADMVAATAAISTADSANKASLSKVRPMLREQEFMSYDEDEYEVALPTPPALKLDSAAASPAPDALLAAAVASVGAGSGGSSSSSNLALAAKATKGPRQMSPKDLEAAATAAAVAASQPSSPEAGSLSNPWEAAGAAAAMLPAGSVAPAHAKLAYRALFDSNSQQQGSAAGAAGDTQAERQLSMGNMSARFGLAELVKDPSDAINSSRTDTDHGTSSGRLLSSRQIQEQLLQEHSAGAEDASGVSAEGAEVPSPRRRRSRSRTGAMEHRASTEMAKQGSPSKHSTGGLVSDPEDTSDAASESDHDVTDRSATWVSSPHAVHQCSRLGQLSSGGGAAVEAATAEGAAGTVSDSSTTQTSPGTGRLAVPRLGLKSISPGSSEVTQPAKASPAQQGSATQPQHSEQSRPDSATHGVGQQVSRPTRAAEGGAGDAAASQAGANSSRSLFSDPSGADYAAEGGLGGSYPEDELLDGTCAELMRVKMERDSYRSEIEVLKNQLRNQDQTIALLSGNFYTPRTTDGGSMSSRYGWPLDKEHSNGTAAQHSYPILGDPSHMSEGGHMQLEGSGSGKSLPESGRTGRLGGSVTQLQGIPEVPSEQLSPEQSDLRPDASKLSIRVQQPSPAEADSTLDDSADEDSSSTTSSNDSAELSRKGGSFGSNSRTCKLMLPSAVKPSTAEHSSSTASTNTAQLAVALSALKFALLLEAAKAPAATASSASAAASGAAGAGAAAGTPNATPSTSPLRRLKKAALSKANGGAAVIDNAAAVTAIEQPIKPGSISTAAATAAAESTLDSKAVVPPQGGDSAPAQHNGGSGRITGGHYGDGPLLASAVLLQLSGQNRKHALVDAASRIAHWVEYDAVKASGNADSSSAPVAGASSAAAAAGGVGSGTADGIAPPKPSSKKRQEEAAEAEARLKQQHAAQQQLLQRLAAAARQADRVAADGSSIAARFASPVPAHTQKVQLRVFRADIDLEPAADFGAAANATQQNNAGVDNNAGAAAIASEPSGKWVRFSSAGGARDRVSTASGAGTTPKHGAVQPVPLKSEVLDFAPAVKPWAGLVPCNKPIQSHPQLPMPRPRPLLLPDHLAAAAFKTIPAAAGGAAADPASRLFRAGPGVTPGAGLVAAARAVHAREAMLAAMPRGAVYSFSVASDHNRSGKPDDGYSKAPSSLDLDSLEDNSPRKLRVGHQGLVAAAAAVGAGAARLGGRKAGASGDLPSGSAAAQAAGETWGQGGYSGSEASSPTRSPARSPTKRAAASALRPLAKQA